MADMRQRAPGRKKLPKPRADIWPMYAQPRRVLQFAHEADEDLRTKQGTCGSFVVKSRDPVPSSNISEYIWILSLILKVKQPELFVR